LSIICCAFESSLLSARLDLLHSIHDTTKETGFYKARVYMTLIHDSLSLMAVVAKRSLQTDDAKHPRFAIAE